MNDELNIDNIQNTDDKHLFIYFYLNILSIILIKFNVHLCQNLMFLTLSEVHYHDVIRVIMNIIVLQC